MGLFGGGSDCGILGGNSEILFFIILFLLLFCGGSCKGDVFSTKC